jgi:MOSC domain-containing protein YiiM
VSGIVEAVNTSRGGVPKTPAFEARLTGHGVEGDHQNDPLHHGGPDRAVVLYSLEVIRALQAEGHPIAPGVIGENLTVSGLDWPTLVPGTVLDVGRARVQVTKYATPCRNIRGAFHDGDFMRVFQNDHPGWSRLCARVLTAGVVRPGDAVTIVGRSADGQ